MHNVIKLIALVVLTLIIVLTYMNKAQAGGPWNDQYCNVKTTQVKMVDTNGVVIKEYTEEVVQCDDGAKDFLHGYGICLLYTSPSPRDQRGSRMPSSA